MLDWIVITRSSSELVFPAASGRPNRAWPTLLGYQIISSVARKFRVWCVAATRIVNRSVAAIA
jgi:hypothetical protein